MFPFNKYIFDNQDIQNDLSCQENLEQITNIPPTQTILENQNKNEFKDDFSFPLNNYYLITPLINNINYIKENEKQTKVIADEKKNNKIFNVKKSYIDTNHCSEKVLDSKESSLKNGKLGRKRKNDNTPGYHNKYSPDNILRKIKHIILSQVMEFINRKIKFITI